MSMTRWISAAIFLVLATGHSTSYACIGKVVGVTDGDTIKVLCEGQETKIRLHQIDAPERNQAFGTKAKEALSTMVFGRSVRLEVIETDKYGRTIATVWINDTDINREMIRLGFAWAYLKYLRDQTLIRDEARARESRKGLWADAHPIAPWDFRKTKRSGKS